MPKFALRYPFFIIMICLVIMVVGIITIAGMPVDLFPKIDMPVVVVATFYSGMPPQQIEADITDTFERFFTLGSNIDHIESRSLTGVSLIKIYFKPGTDPERGLEQHRQSRHGRFAPPAPGHAAARGAGNGCFQPAGLPGDAEGQGAERDRAQGPRAVSGPQPDCQCAGRFRAAALWRHATARSGLCRSRQAGGAQPQPDGRGAAR